MEKKKGEGVDATGRPVIYEERRIDFKALPANCGRVLYALALTERRGKRLGLTRRNIRKVLQHENEPLAGSWDWLFDPSIPDSEDGISAVAVKHAVKKILAARGGTHYPDAVGTQDCDKAGTSVKRATVVIASAQALKMAIRTAVSRIKTFRSAFSRPWKPRGVPDPQIFLISNPRLNALA